MRVLFIVPYVPTRIRVRPYSLLETLIDRGHQVTLATLWSSQAEREQMTAWQQRGLENIVAAPLSRLRSMSNCLGVLPTRTPLQAVYCWQPHLVRQLETLMEGEPFDVIHVEHLRGVHYGLALKDKGVPIVWDSVDCISHLFEQAAQHSRSTFGKWITRLELGRTRRYEGRLVDQFERVLVTSEVDRQALLKLAMKNESGPTSDGSGSETQSRQSSITHRVVVLPNGVDQTYFAPNGHQAEPETLVFSGKMSYHANVTMALHLVQEIMPRIWAERPQVKLTIVGQNPPPTVQHLSQDSRITVTGTVPDVRPYLQRAAVAVVPAVYGAGIQNKVLEAMACATPVVTTDRAIAALSLQPEQDLLVATEADDFARQVVRLLADPDLRQTIGRHGHQYVQQAHTWSRIGAQLEAIYREVL